MCAQHNSKQRKFLFNTPMLYVAMIILGLIAGLSDVGILKTLGLIVADAFIRIFKCISLPVIALSIIVTLSKYRSDGTMRTIWRRTITYTLGTTLIAAAVSCVLYLMIKPRLVSGVPVSGAVPSPHAGSYMDHVVNLIPSSIFAPFLEHQVLSVLFLSMVIGIAIRFIPEDDARDTISNFFRGAHGLLMVIIRWVIAVIPVGLFGFITASVVQLRSGAALQGISQYLAIIVLANLIQGFVILPLWLKSHGIRPFLTMKKMLPALSLAFVSKSSVGSLPVTMETAEKNLQIKPELSRFVLPLCTSINMNGCSAFIFATVIYLMQNQGIELSLASMLVWVVVATVAAIGNAGVPMGCFFLSASLLASMNVPITLMGIILPFYSLIDMLETALNVWSDACVVKVVDKQAKAEEAQLGDSILSDVTA
ncbi:dicarboxylate/amino acid:cation symporter [Legionella londiniensis]|uniref:Amino acid transporter n=1 Tax=Legionella londiniensis TaxID=45068 RepID=A0A0W0VN60_9GAMM|nr:dicarboxylate/amino acid:cation symporter [Legionella londiniensis]KTD21357.1 amino acid transporter [Legionella londiniensis]STX93587.1 amino acid transporter [Legionella londiniensis]